MRLRLRPLTIEMTRKNSIDALEQDGRNGIVYTVRSVWARLIPAKNYLMRELLSLPFLAHKMCAQNYEWCLLLAVRKMKTR